MRFKCDICGYATNRAYDYDRHTHAVHGYYLCHFCNDNFERREDCRKHRKTCRSRKLHPIRTTEKNFLCELCGFATDKEEDFKSHMVDKHSFYICKKCSELVSESGRSAHRLSCPLQEETHALQEETHALQEETQSQKNESLSLQENSQKNDDHFETEFLENRQTTSELSEDSFLEAEPDLFNTIYKSNEKTVHVLLDDPKLVKYPTITFTSDPKEISDFCELYTSHWKSIMSFYRISKISRLFNCRLSGDNDFQHVCKFMEKFIFPSMKRAFKIWLSPSLILKHRVTGKMVFYWPSRFNNCLPDDPSLIKNRADFDLYVKKVLEIDFDEIFGVRPDTSYALLCFTAITFYAVETHVPIGTIGTAVKIPPHLKSNKYLLVLNTCAKSRKIIEDNLCFFRCLQLHKQANEAENSKNKKSITRLYYKEELKAVLKLASEFYGKPINVNTYKGIKFTDLPALERFFEINIVVYQAEKSYRTKARDRPLLLARTTYCGIGGFPSTLHVNEYENHFSYITNVKKYVKAHMCKKCAKAFTSGSTCRIHERTCEALRSIRLVNKPYRPRKNIFELLEEEGFSVDEDCPSSYPFRLTYDFESYFENSEVEVIETESSCYSTHHIMSVAFVSNVPGYEEPTCYVNEGDEKELVLRFLRQLNVISKVAER